MPLPVISGVARIAVSGRCESGAPWTNVLHLRHIASAWVLADDALAMTQIDRLYNGAAYAGGIALLAMCPAGTTLTAISIIPLDGSAATRVYNRSFVGTQVAGTSLPGEVSAVVTFRTGIRGRRARGRVYLPPFYTGERAANGVWVAADVTATVSQFSGFQGALAASSLEHVVASYVDVAARTITTYTANNVFDVQRRRKQ